MNKTEAAAKIEEMHAAAMAEKHVIGVPYGIKHVAENGKVIFAIRCAGAVRFSINGTYKSRAKALAVLIGEA